MTDNQPDSAAGSQNDIDRPVDPSSPQSPDWRQEAERLRQNAGRLTGDALNRAATWAQTQADQLDTDRSAAAGTSAAPPVATPSQTTGNQTNSKPVHHPDTRPRPDGIYLDGWADLVEGRGELVDDVNRRLYDNLVARQMPDVDVVAQDIKNREIQVNQTRYYTLTATYPKGTTYAHIGRQGQDLLVSWRTFHRPMANMATWLTIGTISLLAAFIGGSLFRRALGIRVMGERIFPETPLFLGCFLPTLAVTLLIMIFIFGLAGQIRYGDATYYFIRIPTLFDADDLSGMSMAVHKAMLRSLDEVGINQDMLRLKRDFTAGRRGETL
jgi:hypothetical protein